jgi:hypothetical protein
MILLFPEGENLMSKEKPMLELFAKRPGNFDRKWNLVCLDETLHRWWHDFRLAFKVLGKEEIIDEPGMSSLKLQLTWMKSRIGDPLASLPRTAEGWAKAFTESNGDSTMQPPFIAAARPRTLRLVKSGDIFYYRIQTHLADRAIMAFQIQWAAINIAAMAGGTEALEHVSEDLPDWFDEVNGMWKGEAADWRNLFDEPAADVDDRHALASAADAPVSLDRHVSKDPPDRFDEASGMFKGEAAEAREIYDEPTAHIDDGYVVVSAADAPVAPVAPVATDTTNFPHTPQDDDGDDGAAGDTEG